MRLAEIFIEREELNGTRTSPFRHFGSFTNPVKSLMVPIGIFGERRKKWHGKKTSNYG
jgi:hypothetical protein